MAAPAPLAIALLTVSDSRTIATDKSGQYLADQVTAAGHTLADRVISPDDRYQIRAIVSRWIADPHIQVIITTGGTGITGRDGTPEAVQVLLDKELEGFGELFRWLSYAEIQTATLQSRAL
ncbi:MAG: molybdenum cofactor synthesis domain-containing protein, partial [Prochlorothrix sp.]